MRNMRRCKEPTKGLWFIGLLRLVWFIHVWGNLETMNPQYTVELHFASILQYYKRQNVIALNVKNVRSVPLERNWYIFLNKSEQPWNSDSLVCLHGKKCNHGCIYSDTNFTPVCMIEFTAHSRVILRTMNNRWIFYNSIHF